MNWNDVIRLAKDGSLPPARRMERSDEEWRRLLDEEAYRVTRQHGTERPGSGEYCASHAPGLYACICCGEPLFDSSGKFESGTGWPSFTEPAGDRAVKFSKDTSFGMLRVEVLCNVCDAHLGHVFPDGPPPGGLRFCINSAALKLVERP